MPNETSLFTAFDGQRKVASGSRPQVLAAVKALSPDFPNTTILIFDDESGKQIDFDLREADGQPGDSPVKTEPLRGPGRPRLGVVAREITLLPRHWDWLSTQPGGASVALRKLVESARRAGPDVDFNRKANERAYQFMSAMAGNLPGFEEAARALFAGDRFGLSRMIADWPVDVRGHVMRLAFGSEGGSDI